MSKHVQSSHRSHPRALSLPFAPSELRRLRTRLHTGEHVVLNQQDVNVVLQIVDMITPDETPASASFARQPKPPYKRQQHRPMRNR